MCEEDEAPCQAAGLGFYPDNFVDLRGVAGVSSANDLDHATLAHETGHTLRSSGWYWSDCTGPDSEAICAPDGKPGWSCDGLVCAPD